MSDGAGHSWDIAETDQIRGQAIISWKCSKCGVFRLSRSWNLAEATPPRSPPGECEEEIMSGVLDQ